MTDSRLISLSFVAVFLAVQGLGLHIGQLYFNAIQAGVAEPIVSNPESISTSLYLISYILIATVVIMLIIKFKRNLLRALEIFVLFMSSWITFGFLIPVSILYIDVGMILAIALIIWKLKRPGFASQTTSVVFSLSGIGSILGASLGVIPSLVFLLAVSVYDFISVFLTKHMVFMAKAIVKEP
ncbi:MAG TPA: presenilin family intramembrane aspartyl protease, partial [archaeon]|nr:presenilin family intramembrane aspartyl protease [archaeon]